MNLTQMIELAQSYVDDSRGRVWGRPKMVNFLNAAMDDVARVIQDVDETYFSACQDYSVVSNADSLEFALPTDFAKALAVERLVTGDVPVPSVETSFSNRHPVYDHRFAPDGLAMPPTHYFRGEKLGIVRPQESYTLRLCYTKVLARMDATNGTPEIPSQYHDLICLGAAKRAVGSEGGQFSPDLEQLRQEQERSLRVHMETRSKTGTKFVNVID